MINRRFNYFCDPTNWLELTMYILALLYTTPNIDEAYLEKYASLIKTKLLDS